jgi:hypothetical protein
MAQVTCHTEGCDNAGIPLEVTLTYTDETGEVQTVAGVVCGVCGNPITDVTGPET